MPTLPFRNRQGRRSIRDSSSKRLAIEIAVIGIVHTRIESILPEYWRPSVKLAASPQGISTAPAFT
jgi:hypothetical protein